MSNFLDINFLHWGKRNNPLWKVDGISNHYAINFMTSGCIDFSLEFKGRTWSGRLEAQSAWVISPGMHFRYSRQDKSIVPWNYMFVAFYGAFADMLYNSGLAQFSLEPVKIFDSAHIAGTFEDIFRILSHAPDARDNVAARLIELFTILREQDKCSHLGGFNVKMTTLADRLRKDPLADVDFKREAEIMKISYTHFRRLFVITAGLPPQAFLNMLRLETAAKHLRLNPEMTIKEIAERCRFSNVYYFNKAFKGYFAYTPGKYRKKHSIMISGDMN